MIIVFGSLNIDLVMPVGHFPKPGETVLCSTDYLSRPGGKGSNQAVAAARAGAKVAFVGKIGDDAFGRRCMANLKNHSIWTSGIGISERPTGCATIAVDMTGANFIMVAPGANLDATSDQMPDEVFNPRNIILTQLEVSPQETLSVLARAHKNGATTILNASPAPKVSAEALKNVDYLIMNEIESHQLARHLNITATDPREIARAMAKLGHANIAVIITLEDKGSVAVRHGDTFLAPPLKVEPVDTTGAGDAFCGIFAASLLDGHTWLNALHYASVGASLSCLGLGAQGATPTMEDIEEHFARAPAPQKIG
jgi:ribokinase